MYRDHTVAVILPAYNEAEHVGDVIEAIPEYVDRVYAIDDCSTDDTWSVLRHYGTFETLAEVREPIDESTTDRTEVIPIGHFENRGAGGALKTGYERARRDSVDLTVTLDADGQMDPDAMDRLLDPLVEGTADFSKGNRLNSLSSQESMPPFRLLGNWLLTLLTRVASGYWDIRDPQNGYTAISARALEALDLDAIPDGHDYPNHMLTQLNVAGMHVADVAMPAVYGDESSTIRYWSFIPRTSLTLLDSLAWRLRQRYLSVGFHPLVLVYVLAGLGTVLGTFAGLSMVWSSLAGGAAPMSTAGRAMLFTLGGLALLTVAVLLGSKQGENTGVIRR